MPTLKFKGKAARAVFDALTAPPMFLIMYKGGRNGDVLWWRANRSGYTIDVTQAGQYSKDEADSIADIRGLDVPVPVSDIGTRLKVRQVVCIEDGENHKTLKGYQSAKRADHG